MSLRSSLPAIAAGLALNCREPYIYYKLDPGLGLLAEEGAAVGSEGKLRKSGVMECKRGGWSAMIGHSDTEH